MPTLRQRGFTLIELMIAVAVVAILSAIAMPAYTQYVQRSRVPPLLDGLSSVATRMEQYYQDTGKYGTGTACGVVNMPTPKNATITCTSSGQAFTATATGSGPLAGYVYTIDNTGTRATTAFPGKSAMPSCWSIRGGICDS